MIDMNDNNIVIPGQLLAESSGSGDDSFMNGHGTYIVEVPSSSSSNTDSSNNTSKVIQLRASIYGIVQRINQLIVVESMISKYSYTPQIGDYIIGRVLQIKNDKWILDISYRNNNNNSTSNSTSSSNNNYYYMTGILPLSGVQIPTSIIQQQQRKRTIDDQYVMNQYITVGDIIACEVHKVPSQQQQHHNTIMLHTRNGYKYGKLINGCCIHVPCQLLQRRKNYSSATIVQNQYLLLFGCNGTIWIQRNYDNNSNSSTTNSHVATRKNNNDTQTDSMDTTTTIDDDTTNQDVSIPDEQSKQKQQLVVVVQEEEERVRTLHNETIYTMNDRQNVARIYNCIVCLCNVQSYITPEAIMIVYERSLQLLPSSSISKMLLPHNIVVLTKDLYKS